MRTYGWMLALLVLMIGVSCHSESNAPEPTSAEATQGGDDAVNETPDGTIGPNVGENGAPPVPAPNDGMGPGSGGPPDIGGGAGGAGGIGGEGGAIE